MFSLLKLRNVMNTLLADINDFLKHCTYEKNLSTKTIKSYRIDLTQLMNFLIKNDLATQTELITKVELRQYLEELSSLKPKSIKRKTASIKAMFNYLEFEDKIAVNPWRKMKVKIKESRSLPRVMDLPEIKKIFKAAYLKSQPRSNGNSFAYFEYLRNIAVIELLFSTGARVSEISGLKTKNINLHNGNVTIRGKGNKERIIQICNSETLKLLQDYFDLAKTRVSDNNNYFLVNRLGNRLSDQSIRNIIKKLTYKAGLHKHITPHMFRHTFATLLLEKDVDIKYIQLLLGHSSIMTTQIYTHVNRAKQKKILRTKHPRKDFSLSPF